MGFQRKTYLLDFEGTDFDGLHVRLRGMTFDELQVISALQGAGSGDIERLNPMLDVLGAALIWWDLEDEVGRPVPTADFRGEDSRMLLEIITAWTTIVGDIPAPLPSGSPNGKPLEEAQIPMEIPSSSHPNSNTPS